MNNLKMAARTIAFCAVTGFAGSVAAHHGPHAEPLYDTSGLVELEGEITDVFWRNPHARFRIRVTSGPETGEIWEMETNPVGILLRTGFTPELIPIGSKVKVAGLVARRKPRQMGLFNVLLPNGLEFADAARPNPLRFSEQRLNLEQTQASSAQVEAATRDAAGVFRVWGRERTSLGRFPDDSVLTAAARAAKAEYDPVIYLDNPDCIPPGMPTGMMIPSAFQFVDEGDTILLRVAEYDLVRTIHMNSDVDPKTQPATPLGYSDGKWEDETLVVTTTRIDWPISDRSGVPQSADAIQIERFTPAADGSTMAYELTSVDPVYLIGAPVRPGTFTWRPGREIEPFECAVWDEAE